jgi:hypothetical protein
MMPALRWPRITQHAFVPNFSGHTAHHHIVVDAIEEFLQIQVHQPAPAVSNLLSCLAPIPDARKKKGDVKVLNLHVPLFFMFSPSRPIFTARAMVETRNLPFLGIKRLQRGVA